VDKKADRLRIKARVWASKRAFLLLACCTQEEDALGVFRVSSLAFSDGADFKTPNTSTTCPGSNGRP